jgi:hypothetical protein
MNSATIMKFFRDLFTESDGTTWDLGRVQGTIAFATFLGLSIFAYAIKGQPFDPQAWGIGFGAVSAAYGAMIWMKDKEKGKVVDTAHNPEQDRH